MKMLIYLKVIRLHTQNYNTIKKMCICVCVCNGDEYFWTLADANVYRSHPEIGMWMQMLFFSFNFISAEIYLKRHF